MDRTADGAGSTSQGLPVGFNVGGNQTAWGKFDVLVGFPKCIVELTSTGPAPITNHRMTVGGKLGGGTIVFVGTFSDKTHLTGTISANNASVANCGSVSGNGSWTATWQERDTHFAARECESGLGKWGMACHCEIEIT